MNIAAELVNFIKHICRQEMQDIRTHHWGHISNYNVQQQTVKVLIPSMRDQNGNMYETGDLPMGSMMVGNGWGFQYAPFHAQATPTNLTGGEQVQVALHDRKNGVGMITKMAFNMNMTPPGAGNADGTTSGNDDATGTNPLNPGEFIWKNQPGTFMKWFTDGHIALFTTDKFVANITADCDLNVLQGNLNVVVEEGDANTTVSQGNAVTTVSEGDATLNVTVGDINATAGQDINFTATRDINLTAGRNITRTAP